MIVGTAGHIDHGKTTLVRALTGVDTDRLPEEKRRGISIELGYAYLDVPPAGSDAATATATGTSAERIGFIDVPGHERLVHTMLAGATGIDYGLLLVAADDGVMPQTREHLAVLSLLGVARGAVVVTKIDVADADRVAEVVAEARALVAGTSLAAAAVLPVSATSGAGVDALRSLLFDAARATPAPADADAAFRLAVDRGFTLAGVGTVVTGTVRAGRVAVGDELELVPPVPGRRLRVRGVHAQNRAVATAHAGQRCAVALAGIAKDEVARGQWLVTPAVALATERLDATLTLWHGEAQPLRSGTPVHVHVGAADVLATVAVLAAGDVPGAAAGIDAVKPAPDRRAEDVLRPGATATVQLVLRQPIAAWRGDRLVLRDNAASRTLAGGRVLDPFAPARSRRTPQRLAELAALARPTAAERLGAQLAGAPNGVSLERWARAEGRAPGTTGDAEAVGADAAALGGQGALVAGDWALGAAARAHLGDAAVAALRAFHARQPDAVGPAASQLRRIVAPRLAETLWSALLASLAAAGTVTSRGAFCFLPEHAMRLSAADERLAQKLAPRLVQAGFDGAWARDLARDLRESEPLVRTTLARLAQSGALHQTVPDLYHAPQSIVALAGLARRVAAERGGDVTAAAFRDAAGLGRKRAIQLLEYFDRVGLLRRVGDVHRLRPDAAGLFDGS